MKNRILITCYFVVTLLFMLFRNTEAGLVLKALIIPVLAIFFLLNVKVSGNRYHIMILIALIFSWFGDIFLGIETIDLFVPGLVCFLLAHIMYLTVFFTTKGDNYIIRKRIWVLAPVVAYGLVLLYLLFPGLADMKIPVIIYTIVILTMVSSAVNRYGKVKRKSWLMVLSGAILFLLSDSGIAIDNFYCHFLYANEMIMLTYVLAQYLIVKGYLRGVKEEEN